MTAALGQGGAAPLSAWALAEGVLLLTWEAPSADAQTRFRPFIDGRPAAAPFAHIAAAMATGCERHLIAVRADTAAAVRPSIEVRTTDQRTVAAAEAATGGSKLADPALLLGGLTDAGRFRVTRFLVETIVGLFRLGGDRALEVLCRRVFHQLFDRPAPLTVHCSLRARTVLAECGLDDRFEAPVRAVVIGGGQLRALPSSALTLIPLGYDGARRSLALPVPSAIASSGAAVVVLGDGVIAGRLLAPCRESLPAASSWLAAGGAAARRLSRALIDTAARLAEEDAGAEALARELAMIVGGDARGGVGGHVDLAASGIAGLFISGWFEDRAGLLDAIECERLGETEVFSVANLHRSAHPADDGRGFAVVQPWGKQRASLATVTLSLRLKSGTRLPLWHGQPTPADVAVINSILAAVPPTSCGGGGLVSVGGDEAGLAILEPWLRAERNHRAAQAVAPELIGIGAPAESAAISVVTPLGDDPRLLRCTLTTLAMASRGHRLEIVFVTDRSRIRAGQVRLLRGLAATFGLSGRLAVFDGAAGTGQLLNGGAVAAKAPLLVLLGVGVIAEQPDWLARLARGLERGGGNCIAGARILGADQGIRDAGLMLEVDALGHLDLSPRFDGFPRDYPDAAQPHLVDAVSAAAMAMTRGAFEQAGGFDDRYLTSRYREADFCLEFRRRGGRVLALSDPVLSALGGAETDLEASARAVAAGLDRRLFAERWREAALGSSPLEDQSVVGAVGRQAGPDVGVAA